MAREILSTKVFRSRDRDYLAEKRSKNNGGLEEEVRARGGVCWLTVRIHGGIVAHGRFHCI